MAGYPKPLEKLIFSLKKIPGIGPKSAERMAFFFLSSPDTLVNELADNLKAIKLTLSKCPRCFSLTDHEGMCDICADHMRTSDTLCVLETYRDLLTIESMGEFRGRYHILEGHLSPLDGITPDKLRINELIARIESEKFKEVIMATNPNVEGDATAYYIAQRLKKYPVRVTRLAKGLPVGSDLEFADSLSLSNSLKNREEL